MRQVCVCVCVCVCVTVPCVLFVRAVSVCFVCVVRARCVRPVGALCVCCICIVYSLCVFVVCVSVARLARCENSVEQFPELLAFCSEHPGWCRLQ